MKVLLLSHTGIPRWHINAMSSVHTSVPLSVCARELSHRKELLGNNGLSAGNEQPSGSSQQTWQLLNRVVREERSEVTEGDDGRAYCPRESNCEPDRRVFPVTCSAADKMLTTGGRFRKDSIQITSKIFDGKPSCWRAHVLAKTSGLTAPTKQPLNEELANYLRLWCWGI